MTNMSNEQRRRMAERQFESTDPEQRREMSYTIQVSGGRVWLYRKWEEDWDNEQGTGHDVACDCWSMSVGDLKELVKGATWTIEKSEAFERANPASTR